MIKKILGKIYSTMNRKEKRNPIRTDRDIYNESPTMINEKDYIPKNCVFCNVRMESIHDTHNP